MKPRPLLWSICSLEVVGFLKKKIQQIFLLVCGVIFVLVLVLVVVVVVVVVVCVCV